MLVLGSTLDCAGPAADLNIDYRDHVRGRTEQTFRNRTTGSLFPTITMGLLDIAPPGVVSGKDVYKVFDYARENKFAIPAFNVTVRTFPTLPSC